MSWVRLDDQFPDHIKVAGLGNSAFRLHITAMCYANSKLTDGLLSPKVIRRIGWACDDLDRDIAELVEANLWEPSADGYRIHDFLEYNLSRAAIIEKRERTSEERSKAGTAGAAKRWQSDGKPDSKTDGKPMANDTQDTRQDAKQTDGPKPKPNRERDRVKGYQSGSASAPAALPPLPPQAQVFVDHGGSFPTGKMTDGTPKRARAVQYICEHVGSDPAALAFWGRVVAGYCAQWSPKSYTVMVQDYYLQHRIPGEPNRHNGHGAPAKSNAVIAMEMLQAEEDAANGIR